jgi:hypothetical protein
MLNDVPQMRANGTIGPFRFVKVDTTADNMVLQAGAGDAPLGVTQQGMRRAPGIAGSDVTQAALQGEPVAVFGLGTVCQVLLGTGGCTSGALLKSDTNGAGVAATTGDECGARSLQTGTAGQLVLVQVLSRKM